jgi:hypothetical protein
MLWVFFEYKVSKKIKSSERKKESFSLKIAGSSE